MFSVSESVKLDFREHYRELLDLEDGTSLYDLVGIEQPSPSVKGVISSLSATILGSAQQNPHKELVRVLKTTIGNWVDYLDRDLEDTRFQCYKFRPFKEVTSPLLEKVNLIRSKIQAMGIENQTLDREIDRLDRILNRVSLLPEPADPFIHDFSLHHYPSYSTFGMRYLDSRSSVAMDMMLTTLIERDKKIQCSVRQLCRHNPETGEGWEASLIEAFKQITEVEVIKALKDSISTIQVLHIIVNLINNREQESKLPYLLMSLPSDTFGDLVVSLQEGDLNALNRILQAADPETKQWIEEKSTAYSQEFIEICNHHGGQIDALCKRLRLGNCAYIDESDINRINELSNAVILRYELSLKLATLYHEVLPQGDTKHTFSKTLIKGYFPLRSRLTEKVEYPERPAGNVWGIIYRNVFEHNNLTDDQEAYEIFASWAIVTPLDYRRIGLLGEISDHEFARLQESQQVFVRARDNLVRLRIRTVADWKENNIYNREMFSRFLSRQ